MGAGMRRNSSIFQSTLPQGERLFGIYSRQREGVKISVSIGKNLL